MGKFTASTMNQGVLIYAFNNDSIDYYQQAVWCAGRVNKYLDLPVTIVTDSGSQRSRSCSHSVVYTQSESGGIRVYRPSIDSRSDQWFNSNRYQSYELSPYEQTLVIDSDYVVCSDRLLTLFDSNIRVTAMKHVYDITDRGGFRDYQVIGQSRIGLHHYWATVLYFDRSDISKDFFDLVTMIKTHYRHYANLYRFPSHPFRNDFAVTIALNTLYGHVPDAVPVIPWSMANVFSDVEITTIDQETFELEYVTQKDKKHRRLTITGEDFHFMNKHGLARIYEH
jgi:hypothetical protein